MLTPPEPASPQPGPGPSTHEMIHTATSHSGAEEWSCPQCGRRLVFRWTPYEKVVLSPGDEVATHTGGRGGLRLTAELRPVAVDPTDDERVWLDGLGIRWDPQRSAS